MKFRLEYRNSVKKELQKLPRADRRVVTKKILSLLTKPLPPQASKLKGSTDLYKIRQGDYRIVYQIRYEIVTIVIVRIGHRSEVYRKL